MNYDRFIQLIVDQQKLLGVDAQVSKRWANVGRIDFCADGEFVPFFVACFSFNDMSNTLAYFLPGPRCEYTTGIGCMPNGAIRQETFQIHEADTALANLMTYAKAAREGRHHDIPTRGVCLNWDESTIAKHAAVCR